MSSPKVFKAEWEEAARELKAANENVEEIASQLHSARMAREIARDHLEKLATDMGIGPVGSMDALADLILEMVDPWPRASDGTPLARPA